ncbi:MAG: ribonuclease E/G [Anaerococcus sp.]|nr:ribonuclease E/G [Anaerococcus sp.]
MDYKFIDKKEKLIGYVKEGRIKKIKFYDSKLGNIYRGRVKNKIDSLGGYFIEYEKGEDLYLNSTIAYKVGDNVIVQYVREPANGKLALGSLNFSIENDKYRVERYPLEKRPKLKKGEVKDIRSYKDLWKLKERLIREEKFCPSPKLLLEKSPLANIKEQDLREVSIRDLKEFNDLKEMLKQKKIYKNDQSIIIDSLETMTVIDVNSSGRKSKNKKDTFLENINLDLIDLIVDQLVLRNLAGMVVIDFLRNKNKEKIDKALRYSLDARGISYKAFGFTAMGLYELTIKRRGDRLIDELTRRGLLS